MAAALPDHESVMWRTEVANFHCELAAGALANSRLDEADMHVADALKVNPRCVRASLS